MDDQTNNTPESEEAPENEVSNGSEESAPVDNGIDTPSPEESTDAGAAISCVMWRSAAERLGWRPEQGAAVLAHGRVSVYPARGNYQIYVDWLKPAGLGDLHAQF